MTIRTSYKCDICGEEFDDNVEAMRHEQVCGKSKDETVTGIVMTISSDDMKFHARKDVYAKSDVRVSSTGSLSAGYIRYDAYVRSWKDDEDGDVICAGIKYIKGEFDERKAARELIAKLREACADEINSLNGEIALLIEKRAKYEECLRRCDEIGRCDDRFVDELIKKAMED